MEHFNSKSIWNSHIERIHFSGPDNVLSLFGSKDKTTPKTAFMYLVKKLNDPKSSHKTFWSAYSKFLNKKKITNIPPIESENAYITCFKEKAELFNTFFSKQCTPLDANNDLPSIPFKTRSKLLNFQIDQGKLLKILNSLNSSKASGPDDISIRMLQLCPNTLSLILKCLF